MNIILIVETTAIKSVKILEKEVQVFEEMLTFLIIILYKDSKLKIKFLLNS